mmetsp:Transcript_38148/g.89654  ORF Transcript_38148/g.89654 Transcript_38148/m.89654 type:complete len:113 (-) Transcript_38148:686-1024(-)
MRKEVMLYNLSKNPEIFNPAGIPYSTMARWLTKDAHGVPSWQRRRDVEHLTGLPQSGGVKGGGCVLGEAAERELCRSMARAAHVNMPFQYDEVEDAVRNTAIELKRVVAKTA